MLRLSLQPLPGRPREFHLEGDRATIGRSSACDLQLPSRYVSRLHAQIVRSGEGETLLEDLASHNGTKLNGEPVTAPSPLAIGDVIDLPGFRLTVRAWGPSAVVASSSSSISTSSSGY